MARTRKPAEPEPNDPADEPLLPGGPLPIPADAELEEPDAEDDAAEDDAGEEAGELADGDRSGERVGRWADPRFEVRRILRERLDERILTLGPEAGSYDGLVVVTARNVAEAFDAPLPDASPLAANVRTPAIVYVDLVCPLCGIATSATVELRSVLTVEASGLRELKAKPATKGRTHVCGQTRIEDAAAEAEGQERWDLGDLAPGDASDDAEAPGGDDPPDDVEP